MADDAEAEDSWEAEGEASHGDSDESDFSASGAGLSDAVEAGGRQDSEDTPDEAGMVASLKV